MFDIGYLKTLDSRLRGNDAKGRFKTFYKTINVGLSMLTVRLWRIRRSVFQNNPVRYNCNLRMPTNKLAFANGDSHKKHYIIKSYRDFEIFND